MSDTKSNDISLFLEEILSHPKVRLGEVAIVNGRRLVHWEDRDRRDLEVFTRPSAAREIAVFDDHGNYRPLKGAPTLRHGWELHLDSKEAVREALDYLYPAAIGLMVSFNKGRLKTTELRHTLERQSGMYRVARNISNPDAMEVIATQCGSASCRRRILWKIDESLESPVGMKREPAGDDWMEIPFLCAEGCNLLVSALRRRVKGEQE